MTSYPEDIKFKYPWRKYQQRVLNDLQDHIKNGHLHIIAPPGSGKTVLGLEVAIRLNQPTLILAPTIAIRNQWIQRFCELFLQTPVTPDWISRDIRNPTFMTVVTYQGIHAACNNLKEEEESDDETDSETATDIQSKNSNLDQIVNELKKQNIKTIVVDEAHHLKNEWWQTLTQVKEKLNPIMVGLTATPPYDVTPAEWHRYLDLNGPVDTEISVPELVIEGDLCPHQDYICFSHPTDRESQVISDFRQNIEILFQEIKTDETILKAIENHPIWIYPNNQLDWIYTNISHYSACLIFLHANGREIPEPHLEIIGDKNLEIPTLDYAWMETLLDFYLFKEKNQFKQLAEHQKNLENRLRRYGALEGRKINFLYNKRVSGSLSSSISKLESIQKIVDFEYQNLGKDLRLVILSDYIRKEYFSPSNKNLLDLNKIGVIPIFEKLRRNNPQHKKIGVLTGSIVIIPTSALGEFKAKAVRYGIAHIQASPVPYDSQYMVINQTESLKNDIVHIVTQIFQQGELEILVGTKSLLGEGWDAPAINTLILASFVGSFVLSNQMRGRAIRTENGNPDKTGNIWHLVCLDPNSTSGGDDFEVLKRRFKSFVGISFKEEPGIENGIGRLNLPENIRQREEAEQKNLTMFSFAADRENLKQRWHEALASGITLVEEIRIPFGEDKPYRTLKAIYFRKTIGYMMATLAFSVMGYLDAVLQGFGRIARNLRSIENLYAILAMVGFVGVLLFGRQTYKTFKLYIKYRDISKDLHQIGQALLYALINARIIHTDRNQLKVKTSVDTWGAVYCHLEGGTTFEKSTFINALQEIIAPIENPRYVIIRKNTFMLFVKQKDYHSVPDLLGRNKNIAEDFRDHWESFVGKCELIFTRTIEGRKLILQSRIQSLAAQIEEQIEHVNKWR